MAWIEGSDCTHQVPVAALAAKEDYVNRRTLSALAAAALVSLPRTVVSQSYDPDTCIYGGTLRTMFEMMSTAFMALPGSTASDPDLAFGLYRLSAISRAGHEVLSALEPEASIAETHKLLLEAMAVIAAAGPDIQLAITLDDREALSRAEVVANQSWELLTAAQNAGGTLPEDGTVRDCSAAESTPATT